MRISKCAVLAALAALAWASAAHARWYADAKIVGREPSLKQSLTSRNVTVRHKLSSTLPDTRMRLQKFVPDARKSLVGRESFHQTLQHQNLRVRNEVKHQYPSPKYDRD